MARSSREQFLETAEALFAERGFYGTSIAAVAGELGLTKQALLHHFGSKEKLYGQVLKRISERFEAFDVQAEHPALDPTKALTAYLIEVLDLAKTHTNQTRLLMRELLDNNERAKTAEKWFLKPFLINLITLVKAVPNWQRVSDADALTLVYQLLGAINYFAISQPTLTGIFGHDTYSEFEQAFPEQIAQLIEVTVGAGPRK